MAHTEAQPNIQPTHWWTWLLLVIALILLTLFLAKGCGPYRNDHVVTTRNSEASQDSGWNAISFNGPLFKYDEITDSSINVSGGEGYAVYSVDENVLFDSDKSSIRQEAQANLEQLAGSLNKRFPQGQIRIYGHTDAQGTAGYNRELAEQRAASVRNWLVTHGHMEQGSISLHPVGEAQPVASNATEAGRQQNRRVEIVARSGGAGHSAQSGGSSEGASSEGGTSQDSAAGHHH
ncbi:MAG: OmpA family protein [Williamsia sp.]|nr:OmpA family protein [Williamsia sp.]